MKINLFQIQYNAETKPTEDSGLMAFDCRDQPEFLKREMAHMIRFYDQVVSHADSDAYFALLSPKFSQKTGLTIAQLKQHMHAHPQQDIYIFNPFPMNVYCFLNVIEHGERFHPGLKALFKNLFTQANIKFDLDTKFRNGNNTACFCNYWIAKKSFWDEFINLVKTLDVLIENMSVSEKNKYFTSTNYLVEACFYPFIFERLISIFLVMNINKYAIQDYKIPRKEIKKFNFGRVFNAFYIYGGRTYFDAFEKTTSDIDYISKQLEILRAFFFVKVKKGSFYLMRKLACSIQKSLNCIYVLIYVKRLAKQSMQPESIRHH